MKTTREHRTPKAPPLIVARLLSMTVVLAALLGLMAVVVTGCKNKVPTGGKVASPAAVRRMRLAPPFSTCTDADLGAPRSDSRDSQVCTGPWAYLRYNKPCYVNRADAACPKDHDIYVDWCRSPDFGTESEAVEQRVRREQSCRRQCRTVKEKVCDGEKCDPEPPACTPRPGRPCKRETCWPKCTTVSRQECTTSCTPADCSADQANLSQGCAAPSCRVDPIEKDPNGQWCEVKRWRTKFVGGEETARLECRNPAATERKPVYKGTVYQSCRHASHGEVSNPAECGLETPSKVYFSEAKQARSALKADKYIQADLATCTTCDDLPTDGSPSAVEAKFACLTKPLPAAAAPADVITAAERQRRVFLKLLLERRAHQLRTSYQDQIIELYSKSPGDRPTCGDPWQPQSQPDAISGMIQLCRRLGHSHDQSETQALSGAALAERCIGAVTPAKALADSDSRKPLYVTESAKGSTALLATIFTSLAEVGTNRRQTAIRDRVGLISKWFNVVRNGVFSTEDADRELWQSVNTVTSALWSGVYSKALAGLQTRVKEPQAFSEYLGTAATNDREVLEAIFSLSATDSSLAKTPILALFADATAKFSQRLQEYAVYHDMACRFLDCAGAPRKTELSVVQRVFAAIPDESLLRQELAAASALEASGMVKFSPDWANWKRTLGLVATNHSILRTAVLDALKLPSTAEYHPTMLLQTSDASPPPLRTLANAFEFSAGMVARYDKTGQFLAVPGSGEIVLGFRDTHQKMVMDAVRAASERLRRAKGEYKAGRDAMLNALVLEARSAETASAGAARAAQLLDEIDTIAADMQSLGVTAEQDTARFSDFAVAYGEVMAAAQDIAPMIPRPLKEQSIRALDAYYSGGEQNTIDSAYRLPGSNDPLKIASADAGDLVTLAVGPMWSPTCAMRSLGSFGGYDLKKAAEAAPDTTSQGFTAQFSDGQFDAHSHQRAWDTQTGGSFTTCLHAEGGFNWNIFLKVEVTSRSDACLSASTNYTWSRSNSWGNESRTSAAFTNGLRLPNTPFPDFPVGALLAVLAKPNTKEIIDVQVVSPERFAIVFRDAADLYLVVNDLKCDASRGQLTMQGTQMKGANEEMRRLGQAMATVQRSIREEAAPMAMQGRLLPSQTAQLRAMAWPKLRVACKCDPDVYAAQVRGFYALLIETEVARVERQVEMTALQRRLQQILVEIDSLSRQVKSDESQAQLGSRLATLALSSLDLDSLRGDTMSLVRVAQSELVPFIALRYPETVTGADGILKVKEDREAREAHAVGLDEASRRLCGRHHLRRRGCACSPRGCEQASATCLRDDHGCRFPKSGCGAARERNSSVEVEVG